MNKLKIAALVITASIASNNYGEYRVITSAKNGVSSVVNSIKGLSSSLTSLFKTGADKAQGVLRSTQNSVKTNLDKLSNNQKITAAVVGGVLASYIAYKVVESKKTKKRTSIA